MPTTSRNKLKIYQWNADGIRPKFKELRDPLLNSDIDVLPVQESKLRKTDKHHPSKAILQSEKIEKIFLEVAFYCSFERTSCSKNHALLKRRAWRSCPFVLKLLNQLGSNLQCLSTKHLNSTYFVRPFLNQTRSSYTHSWQSQWSLSNLGSLQPQDQRGDVILDWVLDNDLHNLNNGYATRTSRITGNDNIPDIYLCGSNWSVKTSWRLAEPIGNSDHLPIIIELNHKICYNPVIPRSARWHRNGVDWSSFTNEVESKMANLPNEPNLSLRVLRFNEILISAATTPVGKPKPSKKSKPWINPHVPAKIRNWNRVHKTVHQNRQEWIDACREANEAINEAKT